MSSGDGEFQVGGHGEPYTSGEQCTEHAVHEEVWSVCVGTSFGYSTFDCISDPGTLWSDWCRG